MNDLPDRSQDCDEAEREVRRLEEENATLEAELRRGDSWLDTNNARLREVLEELEWHDRILEWNGTLDETSTISDAFRYCPICGSPQSRGHAPDCRLETALETRP